MKYYSTNHQTPDVTLQEAVVKGLAADKGLFMPERINALPAAFYENMSQMTLQEVSFRSPSFLWRRHPSRQAEADSV